ncbi:MAG TPA: hypothetical protein VK447_11340 [Myxococcaceae bacterium]|nr:hypothetical protein [Myxococcaceae bacterium]
MQTEDFELEHVLQVLGTLAEKYEESSREGRALRAAGISFLYLQRTGKLDDYRQFLERFDAPLDTIKIQHVFEDVETARKWLLGSEVGPGSLVKIAGITHVVAQGPTGLIFVRTLSPDELREKPTHEQ